jgi:DNA topoisomerase-1
MADRRFVPEDLGITVNGLLVNHFPRYVDYQFTAHLEEELDEIARGEIAWKPVVRNFWKPFINLIGQKETEIKRHEIITEKTDEVCPTCGKNLIIRLGRYGKFLGCEGYPECRFIRSLGTKDNGSSGQDAATGEMCEKCGKPMVVKEGRYGKFLACSGYPDCRTIKSLNKSVPTGIKCPVCTEGEVIEKKTRRNRIFYGCSRYPQCSFATWNKPVNEPCPLCGSPFLVEKESKRYGVTVCCAKKECGYKKKPSDA